MATKFTYDAIENMANAVGMHVRRSNRFPEWEAIRLSTERVVVRGTLDMVLAHIEAETVPEEDLEAAAAYFDKVLGPKLLTAELRKQGRLDDPPKAEELGLKRWKVIATVDFDTEQRGRVYPVVAAKDAASAIRKAKVHYGALYAGPGTHVTYSAFEIHEGSDA